MGCLPLPTTRVETRNKGERLPGVASTLGQRRRRWPNVEATTDQGARQSECSHTSCFVNHPLGARQGHFSAGRIIDDVCVLGFWASPLPPHSAGDATDPGNE